MRWPAAGPRGEPARIALGAAGFLLVAGALLLALPPHALPAMDPARRGSLRFVDREGALLRDQPVAGRRGEWTRLEDLPAWVPAALVAAEDRRFAHHPGVDPLALARAALTDLRRRRIISGGSTITQQLVRLLDGRPRARTLAAKVSEALDALRLELRFSKRDILEQYLNRVPFGRGASGIDAASRTWFGRGPATLSPGEAAFLAILPRSPAAYSRPDWRGRLEARRRALVGRMVRDGVLDAAAAREACRPVEPGPGAGHPFAAPHLTGWLLRQMPPALVGRAGTLVTTLDEPLEEEVEDLTAACVARLDVQGVTQAAVVVIDNATGEVRAMVGSADFFDETGEGQVNGAVARRQPGSALKPFTYALAFESGKSPATLAADIPSAFPADGGPFEPRNYGGRTFGPVRLREALGSSLNIAAVEVLAGVGTDRLYGRLQEVGIAWEETPDHFGLGLTLGAGEVRLLDLAAAYGALARGGVYRAPVLVRDFRDPRGASLDRPAPPPPVRVFDPLAAWWVSDILRDDTARYRSFGRGGVLAMPWPVAVKTGTSSDWRDNWALGFTREWTAGVWVGDFTGRPMHRISGVAGAAPLLRDVFRALSRRGPLSAPPRPAGLKPVVLCALSGAPPTDACPGTITEYFPAGREPSGQCTFHRRVRLDSRTGAPAGPDTPAGRVEMETEVRLPARFASWSGRRALRLSDDGTGSEKLTLVRPLPGGIYFVDPALPGPEQAVEFRAEGGGRDAVLLWSVDGRAVGTTRPPHRLFWRLRPGSHHLTVAGEGQQAGLDFSVVGGSR